MGATAYAKAKKQKSSGSAGGQKATLMEPPSLGSFSASLSHAHHFPGSVKGGSLGTPKSVLI